ncbi:hypothetical protein BVAVS116_D0015 (plasmid) [Borreliella valaisiana VS116]|uniref:Uncharacterized protein n=1 Tax=Borreliella valaisiana VS116 TaxID=445987 RepID=C0R8X0_BORVA|nr:hypothetical protein BVAVS116_D0015 [Borreliella valaisiana VS116]
MIKQNFQNKNPFRHSFLQIVNKNNLQMKLKTKNTFNA